MSPQGKCGPAGPDSAKARGRPQESAMVGWPPNGLSIHKGARVPPVPRFWGPGDDDSLITAPDVRLYQWSCTVFTMSPMLDSFHVLHAIACLLVGGMALYWGITGKDIYPRGPSSLLPLPKLVGRVVCFVVAGGAFYFLVGAR